MRQRPALDALAAVDRRTFLGGCVLGMAALGTGCSAPPEPTPEEAGEAASTGGPGGFPAPSFVETNGIRMAVHERGEGGFPVVFSHGFPELAFSWRHQLPAFADAGFWALAPDQRGYGLTDRPDDVGAYRLVDLCADLAGLLDARGIDRAVFCGHDWGGAVVWSMPLYHPDRVAGVIGVNTPSGRPPRERPPIEQLRALRGEDNYVVAFQEPGVADEILGRNTRKLFELLMRRGVWDAEEFAKLPPDAPERKFQLLEIIEESDPAERPGEPLLTTEELDFFVDTFERTGFTGGINWYRNIDRNWQEAKERGFDYRVDVPCLYVGAEDDVVLPPSSADGMETLIADLEKAVIADCGHWTQQEKPEELNRIAIDWLRRRFLAA